MNFEEIHNINPKFYRDITQCAGKVIMFSKVLPYFADKRWDVYLHFFEKNNIDARIMLDTDETNKYHIYLKMGDIDHHEELYSDTLKTPRKRLVEKVIENYK